MSLDRSNGSATECSLSTAIFFALNIHKAYAIMREWQRIECKAVTTNNQLSKILAVRHIQILNIVIRQIY